jgi:myo-inositol-1-phosphate synthase
MEKIKVGIIGIGNCAKALVEGVQYYNENPEDKSSIG